MSNKIILIESRVDEFEKNFAKKFSTEQKERIFNEIPSKFWSWVGKNLDQISFDESFDTLKNLLDYFNKFGSNLPKTDIFQYSSIADLKQSLDQYATRQRRNYKKVNGANVVLETPKYLVVNPLSFESSCYYGKGTKWCTSGRDSASTFNKYNTDGKLFYIIDKTLPNSDPNYKIGLSRKFDGDESFYNALDQSLYKVPVIESPDFKEILEKIRSYMSAEYEPQITAIENQKREKEEKDRQRRLEIQRIKIQKRNEADERRTEQEWALTPDIDDEGKMAWAVLRYLENEGANLRDREQDERLIEIQTEIDRLNQEYESDPEVRTDILDQINELEEERDEILEMIDVYYILPEAYEHYGLNKFEVVHDDFYQQTFAVGEEEEVEDAAKEYVEQLIDDIGITGFNESFWKNYLDEDAIVSQVMDHFEDDLYSNPEAYLNDEDRMLDAKQMDRVKRSKKEIESLNKNLEDLENLRDEEEDEETLELIENKITYIEEQIIEIEEEIEEIESEPMGDFPDELIQEKIDDIRDDVERNPERYMEDYGMNAEDFVDRQAFIQGVVDEDGYGQLSPYDGNYERFNIMGTSYYVFRID